MLDSSVYRERMDKIQHYLDDTGVDLALLTPSPEFQYLTGIDYMMRERLVALVIQPKSEPFLVVPAFEESDHASHTWIPSLHPWTEEQNPYEVLRSQVGIVRGPTAAAMNESMPLGVFWSLEKSFGGFKSTGSITPMINSMRLLKDESELALMKKAGEVINAAVMKAFSEARVGMSETEVMQIVQNEIVRLGAKPTFAAVQFGENSALPHHDSGMRELRKGDLVLMDCGCSIDGYNTDQTRVGVVGEPSEDMSEVYSIVLKAEETAIERIQAGLTCGAADGIARRIIDDEGYGENFTHRLGHGIGLEVHEPPYLVRGSSEELKPGMCHSVEPGVYLEGRFGIRIEDLVCVRESGVEVLTYSPKDLHRIEV
jgi:Xaa-Pro dipeptidase